jgi:hypothetical protein
MLAFAKTPHFLSGCHALSRRDAKGTPLRRRRFIIQHRVAVCGYPGKSSRESPTLKALNHWKCMTRSSGVLAVAVGFIGFDR